MLLFALKAVRIAGSEAIAILTQVEPALVFPSRIPAFSLQLEHHSMRSIFTLSLLVALSAFSCGSTLTSVFGNKTPHEKYADVLQENKLEKTPEGRQWLAASKAVLVAPQLITVPYQQHGYFHADKARALGLKFTARRGERILFVLTKKGNAPFALYVDLYKDGNTETPLLSLDTTQTSFSIDVADAGTYVLRLQPELAQSGAYSLAIEVGPSLAFPVSGTKAKAGSFWGADRDGGKRRHEGIDIFAPKLTPVIAAADGYITGVREGGIGGKTVWLNVSNKNIYLYYAHLDKQLVQEGQQVKKGEVLGLVGNTGNARYTPSHLHFGIYTFTGPIDPFPFVNQQVKKGAVAPPKNLSLPLQLTKVVNTIAGSIVKPKTIVLPLAATAKGYIAELPDGDLIQVPFASAKAMAAPQKPAVAAKPFIKTTANIKS